MAKSDYALLAVDKEGTPIAGTFVSPCGVEVEIYKTWLYIRDKKGWAEGGSFVEPVIMQVHSGELTYKDVHIFAIQGGPQNGVYCAVWCHPYDTERFRAMVGIGVYGYDESLDPQWVGVSKESLDFLQKNILGEGFTEECIETCGTNMSWEEIQERYEGEEILDHTEKDGWCSYKVRTSYESWTTNIPESLRTLDLSKAAYFNQGDAYFAEQGLMDEVETTKPGEAGPTPIIMQVIEGMKEHGGK